MDDVVAWLESRGVIVAAIVSVTYAGILTAWPTTRLIPQNTARVLFDFLLVLPVTLLVSLFCFEPRDRARRDRWSGTLFAVLLAVVAIKFLDYWNTLSNTTQTLDWPTSSATVGDRPHWLLVAQLAALGFASWKFYKVIYSGTPDVG